MVQVKVMWLVSGFPHASYPRHGVAEAAIRLSAFMYGMVPFSVLHISGGHLIQETQMQIFSSNKTFFTSRILDQLISHLRFETFISVVIIVTLVAYLLTPWQQAVSIHLKRWIQLKNFFCGFPWYKWRWERIVRLLPLFLWWKRAYRYRQNSRGQDLVCCEKIKIFGVNLHRAIDHRTKKFHLRPIQNISKDFTFLELDLSYTYVRFLSVKTCVKK